MKYKVAPWVEPVLDFLWSNKANILNELEFNFYAPDFAGLSKDIGEQIDEDAIDLINAVLIENLENSRTRTAFAKIMVYDLSNGMVIIAS